MNPLGLGDISVTQRAKPVKAQLDGLTDTEAKAYEAVTACLLCNPEWSEANAVKHTKTNWLVYRDAKKKAVSNDRGTRHQKESDGFRPGDPILKNYGKGPISGHSKPKTTVKAQFRAIEKPKKESVELKLEAKKMGRPAGVKNKPKEPVMISSDAPLYQWEQPADRLPDKPGPTIDFRKKIELDFGFDIDREIAHPRDCECQLCIIKPGDNFGQHQEPSKQAVLAKEIAKEFEKSLDKREKAVVQELPAKLMPSDTLTDRTVMFAMIDLIQPFDVETRKRIIRGMIAFCGVELWQPSLNG
jgi:hypothetical protein